MFLAVLALLVFSHSQALQGNETIFDEIVKDVDNFVNSSKNNEDISTTTSVVSPSIVQLENLTREEGRDALFVCKAVGIPRPIMTMRRERSSKNIVDNQDDGVELEETIEGDFKVLRLRIMNVTRSDNGLYYCKASNAAGVTERVGHLEVMFRPDMSRTQHTSVKTWSSNPANLSCIAEANPNASITWKFQGDTIKLGDERFEIFGGVSYSRLLVMTSNRLHEVFGKYTCEARNALGENSIEITLDEAVAPGQITQIMFDKVTPTTITFGLFGPSNDGGMPIAYYVMQYKRTNVSDDKTIFVEWPKDKPYILTGLKPEAKYQFSAAARNEVGEGPWKTEEYVMPEATAPESPLIKTKHETISDYPDKFEVRWEVPNDNGSPIQNYNLRYYRVERRLEVWKQVEKAQERIVGVASLSYYLTKLTPDSYYMVQIRAANQFGNSFPGSVVIKTNNDSSCFGHPCKNGGICFMVNDEFQCICQSPFSGPTCEIGPCSEHTCQNGGTCKVTGNGVSCDCVVPHFGIYCEKDPCSENSCLNGGTCRLTREGYNCDCVIPYFGTSCEKGPCSKDPCLNGGTCIATRDEYNCYCKTSYTGTRCELEYKDNKMPVAILGLFAGLVILLAVAGSCLLWRNLKLKKIISEKDIQLHQLRTRI